MPGTPFTLLDGLLKGGVNELTVVKNEANEDHIGISKLVEAGLVRKMITTHLGLNKTVIGMMNRGEGGSRVLSPRDIGREDTGWRGWVYLVCSPT